MSHKSAVSGSREQSRRARWFSSWNNYLFVVPALIFMVVFIGFPLLYNLMLSFQNVNVYNLSGKHDFIGLSNYIKSLKDPVFYTALQNSAVFTVLSIFFQFTIGFALALFFNQKFPGRNLFRSLMLLAWMLPVVISGTIFQWMMSGDFGVINYFLQTMGIIDQPINWLSEGSTALLSTSWPISGLVSRLI